MHIIPNVSDKGSQRSVFIQAFRERENQSLLGENGKRRTQKMTGKIIHVVISAVCRLLSRGAQSIEPPSRRILSGNENLIVLVR